MGFNLGFKGLTFFSTLTELET